MIKSNESDIRKNALQEVFFCVSSTCCEAVYRSNFFSDFFFSFTLDKLYSMNLPAAVKPVEILYPTNHIVTFHLIHTACFLNAFLSVRIEKNLTHENVNPSLINRALVCVQIKERKKNDTVQLPANVKKCVC